MPATCTLPAVSAATACTTLNSVALPKYVENNNCFPVESNSMIKPVALVNDAGGMIDMKGWTRGNWKSFVSPTIQILPLPSRVIAVALRSPPVTKLE